MDHTQTNPIINLGAQTAIEEDYNTFKFGSLLEQKMYNMQE
jgi:hypothetical protein